VVFEILRNHLFFQSLFVVNGKGCPIGRPSNNIIKAIVLENLEKLVVVVTNNITEDEKDYLYSI
jgi:hypothetical protein